MNLLKKKNRNNCRNRNYWNGLLTGIRKANGLVHGKIRKLPFNVVMYGFDSLSRNAFIRKLPKTYEYMVTHLKADVLQGYNIVGDGTPQALIPVSYLMRGSFNILP